MKNRWPAAETFIRERGLNEVFGPSDGARRHRRARAACTTASSAPCSGWGWPTSTARREVPLYVLNVTYPLVSSEFLEFCARQGPRPGRRGRPARVHRTAAWRPSSTAPGPRSSCTARACFPMAGRIYRAGDAGRRSTAFLKAGRARTCCPPRVRAPNEDRPADPRPDQDRADPPARLLHRLPGTPDLRRDEAGAEGTGQAPDRRRHRLPPVRRPAAVRDRRGDDGLRPWPRRQRAPSTAAANAARSRSSATAGSGTTGCRPPSPTWPSTSPTAWR